MTKEDLLMFMESRDACELSKKWVQECPATTAEEVWNACPHADWLIWLVDHANAGDRKAFCLELLTHIRSSTDGYEPQINHTIDALRGYADPEERRQTLYTRTSVLAEAGKVARQESGKESPGITKLMYENLRNLRALEGSPSGIVYNHLDSMSNGAKEICVYSHRNPTEEQLAASTDLANAIRRYIPWSVVVESIWPQFLSFITIDLRQIQIDKENA